MSEHANVGALPVTQDLLQVVMELRESQRLAGIGSWRWDADTDTVRWSEELFHLSGRDPRLGAVSYADHGTLYSPDSWTQLQRVVEAALGTGAPYELDLEMIRADGTRIWVTARGEVQRDSTGRITGLRGTVQDITGRKRAEEALSTLSRRLIHAQETERARIARELHDDICQRLALLTVTLERLMGTPSQTADDRSGHLEAVRQIVDISASVRALAHELHSSRLQHLGMVAAMKGFCTEISAAQKVEVDFDSEEIQPDVPTETALCLFRVLQEALHNAVRHSGVRQFKAQLRQTQDALHLTVRDNGSGFDADMAIDGRGLGLTSMKERLRQVGGALLIDSQSGRGTTIMARVPRLPVSDPAAPA